MAIVDDYFQMSASIAEAKQQISCKTRERPAGALVPFQAQGIGAVCNIPRLPARRDNATNDSKALPGGPGAVPPRRSKRVPTVVPR